MQKIITRVPNGTIPRSIGKNFMACIFDDNGTIRKCIKFFGTWEEARKFAAKNPEYLMHGVATLTGTRKY